MLRTNPISRGRKWALLALLPLALLIAAACTEVAPNQTAAEERISVSGQGQVSASPDTVVLRLGVSVLRDSVSQAIADAAARMSDVLDTLSENGVDDADIQTTQFAVHPEFDYGRDGERSLLGFRVINSVAAKIHEVDEVGPIIDAVATAGGDDVTIDNIAFTVDDPTPMLEQARELAVADARAKAEQLAGLAGVRLGRVVDLSESGGFATPTPFVERAFAAEAGGVSTPIASGEFTISVSVFIVFALD